MFRDHIRKQFYSVICLILLLFTMIPSIPVHAADTSVRTVRVAFPEQDGMSYTGKTGKLAGYNYDYLQKISEYTGWKMEYVTYPSENKNDAVSDALNDLMEGNVDLMGPILKNEQTEQILEFPENSYGTVYTTLCAPTFSSLRESNFHNQAMIHVGLWTTAATRNAEVINYLDSENITYEITYYETSDEQMEALKNGEVDVVSSVSLSPIANTRIVAQFAARPYFFASAKGNTALMEDLDNAMEQLNHVQPNLQETLFQTYFRSSDEEFALSDDQKHVLSEIGDIQVLAIDYDAPYVYRKNGEPAGMLVELLNDFAKDSGLDLHFTFCETREEAQKQLSSGSYDLLIGLPFTSDFCSTYGFIKSEPVIISNLAYVQSPYQSSRTSIAIVKGLEDLINTSAFQNVMLCDNADECIRAINSGQADVAAGDRSIMEYYIYENYSTLTTSLISGESQNICLAVSRNCPMEFMAIINNFIYSLSDAAKTTYLSSGNSHSVNQSLDYLIHVHPGQFAAVLCLLALLILAGIFCAFYLHQINRKNQELKIANEAKSEFLMRISHDIRTPMNGIIGMLNIADECIDKPEELLRCHDRIRTASNYLLSLINDVLDMSRMESKQIRLDDRSVSLHELVKSCVDITRNQADEAQVTLIVDGIEEFDPPQVIASEQHVRQILLNLISNSIKYNQPGGKVLIGASVIKKTDKEVTCEFIISDNGIGMSEEFQSRMFEPFAQENAGARSEFKGTGLGLSIVKKIIDLKGGTIRVESAPGVGTTFTVTLRVLIDKDYREEILKPETVDIQGMRVLAAEDNSLNAEILQILMEDAGVSVTLVSDGQMLVQEFIHSVPGDYDCIVTDIMMPVMDGYEAARQIRALDRPDAGTIPIIALTANAFSEDEEKALAAGMNAHIAKPFDVEKLKECLARLAQK